MSFWFNFFSNLKLKNACFYSTTSNNTKCYFYSFGYGTPDRKTWNNEKRPLYFGFAYFSNILFWFSFIVLCIFVKLFYDTWHYIRYLNLWRAYFLKHIKRKSQELNSIAKKTSINVKPITNEMKGNYHFRCYVVTNLVTFWQLWHQLFFLINLNIIKKVEGNCTCYRGHWHVLAWIFLEDLAGSM